MATDFGVNHLSPVLGEFLAEFPDITVNMVLNNRYVELISEGFDMAVRIGELEDSSLRARKLTDTTKRMIAAPSYFEKFGRPERIDDLNEHKLLHYSNQSSGNVWKVTAPSGEKRQVRTAGWLSVNDGQSLLTMALEYRMPLLAERLLMAGAALEPHHRFRGLRKPSPLHHAAGGGAALLCRALLKTGTDPDGLTSPVPMTCTPPCVGHSS